jgi:AcrR family transcriptional regulator
MPKVVAKGEAEAFRQRLVEAAERLIVGRDSIDFTMRELAADVGCSPMLPYRYFRDKDDILAAVKAAAFQRFSEALEAPAGAPERAQQRSLAVGDAYVAFAFANPQLYRLMFNTAPEEKGRYPELDAVGARARDTMTNHVRAVLQQGLLVGDPVVIGHLFWASLHGLIVLQLAGQLGPEPGFEALRAAMTQALVFGLRNPDLPAAPGSAKGPLYAP